MNHAGAPRYRLAKHAYACDKLEIVTASTAAGDGQSGSDPHHNGSASSERQLQPERPVDAQHHSLERSLEHDDRRIADRRRHPDRAHRFGVDGLTVPGDVLRVRALHPPGLHKMRDAVDGGSSMTGLDIEALRLGARVLTGGVVALISSMLAFGTDNDSQRVSASIAGAS